jgi:hypothetical protein
VILTQRREERKDSQRGQELGCIIQHKDTKARRHKESMFFQIMDLNQKKMGYNKLFKKIIL